MDEVSPESGSAVDTGFIPGIGKIGKRVGMLPDGDKDLSSRELAKAADVAKVA